MTTFLHRFTVKPHHLDAWSPLWHREVAVLARHGLRTHSAFVETDAEPKVTWLYSATDAERALGDVAADPETAELAALRTPHVFGNLLVRPVHVEVAPREAPGRTVIMRRYRIVGSWTDFLDVWRRIVPVREKYGFPCLFAVSDPDDHLFTWAFGFEGEWADFPAAQRPYYRDPERVELRRVFDHMADYSIHPARRLDP